MNSNRNLIVALIALWCYTRKCNINLANNTAILLILYALLTSRNNYYRSQFLEPYTYTPRLFRSPNNGFPFPFAPQSCQTPHCCPTF